MWDGRIPVQTAGRVKVIKTIIANEFLTAELPFKLKEPARFDYFDHQTRAARAGAYTGEMQLKRPLGGDVYLGMVPRVLTRPDSESGRIVDWLVQMRRLAAERKLDTLICARKASPSQIKIGAVVTHLAAIYRLQRGMPPPVGHDLTHLQREHRDDSESLRHMARIMPRVPLAPVTTDLENRITMAPGISAREAAGILLVGGLPNEGFARPRPSLR